MSDKPETTPERIKKIFPWDAGDIYAGKVATLQNFVDGQWTDTQKYKNVVSPQSGQPIIQMPDTQENELYPFIESLKQCPKHGLHNPILNPERYGMYGDICRNAAAFLRTKEGRDYFTRLIDLVMPKGHDQCAGEVDCVASFLETFSGNNVRNLAFGQTTPGDYAGYEPRDYRWPYGPVAIITPFNFPLEIMALQLLGALFMGNKAILKQSTMTSIVAEAFVRLLLDCGMPSNDMLLIHCGGQIMEKLVTARDEDKELIVQLTQFTGSSDVAHKLHRLTDGRVKHEDAGFNWKITGPNVIRYMIDTVARNCDKDAYAAGGQKCSAESILFVHKNWVDAGLLEKIKKLASERTFENSSLGPILTWNDEQIQKHVNKLLKIPGAKLLFGGRSRPIFSNGVPKCYGAYEPTAIYVPLREIMDNFSVVTTEVFGPLQVITTWESREELDLIIKIFNRMKNHLTAGIVDNDPDFINYVAARTKNGTTYAGIRAVTTGAPEWLHFGPTGHPASAIIGTKNGIISTWSQERMICWNTNSGKY